jgi:cholera toxin transcriptional activator
MGSHPRRVFRFGVFEADQAAGELRKHGIRVKLHSQPFQVLMMLLERPMELVTRDQMRQKLWDDGTFVDFDHGLNTAVNKLREALGDSASVPRYVETVQGRGYRFITPVSRHEDPPGGLAQPVAAILTVPEELPSAPRRLVRTLLILMQVMYLGFYLGALSNLSEIHDIFVEAGLAPGPLMATLMTTAMVLIPVRLYIGTAVIFDFQKLAITFARLFPVLLILDLVWAISPMLLVHHWPVGLAMGISAALIYVPFAQRSLILMFTRRQGTPAEADGN